MREFGLQTSSIQDHQKQIEGISLVQLHEFDGQDSSDQFTKTSFSFRQACIVLQPERYFNNKTTPQLSKDLVFTQLHSHVKPKLKNFTCKYLKKET